MLNNGAENRESTELPRQSLFKVLADRSKEINMVELPAAATAEATRKLKLEADIIKALAQSLDDQEQKGYLIKLDISDVGNIMEYISGAAQANNLINDTVVLIHQYIAKQLKRKL